MTALWSQFTELLKDSGYTLNDLVYCNEDLFLTIVEDMNEFSPLQIASLAKEWKRTLQSSSPTNGRAHPATATPTNGRSASAHSLQNASSGSALMPTPFTRHRQSSSLRGAQGVEDPSTKRSSLSTVLRESAAAPPRRHPAHVKEEAEYLLMKLGAHTGEEYQVSPSEGLVAVEASPDAWRPLAERLERMHPSRQNSQRASEAAPRDALQLLWKLCSPSTLVKMERACVSGAPFGLSNQDDADDLCSSAVVFYSKEATRLSAPATELGELFRDGWALVAFDVAVGRTRTVTKDEAQDLSPNLHRFAMEQCLAMLEEAGFDSFHIPSRNAVAVCHMHQAMPRFVVYVSAVAAAVPTRRLGDRGSGAPPQAADAVAVKAKPPTPAPSARTSVTGRSEEKAGSLVVATAPASPPRRSPEDLLCTVHTTKTVEFWSPTEKRLLCSHCLYYDGYTQTNCVPIEQAAREEVPRLERWVQNATTFSQEIKGVFDLLDAAKADVMQSQERVRSDVAQGFTRLRSRLDALEATLVQQCQQKAQQNQSLLQDTSARVSATVQFVQRVVAESDVPIAAYRGGSVDTATCVALLRMTQRAFSAWEPVAIPAYEGVGLADGASMLQPLEDALKEVAAVATEPGKIQLPEAIDVNYLKSDCDV